MKKAVFILVLLVFCVSLGASQAAAGPKYKWKLSAVAPPTETSSQHFAKFAEMLKEKSGGDIEVTCYFSSQLGTGRECFEQVQQELLDIATDSYANLVSVTPAFEPFHLPFLFESRDQYLKVWQSPVLKKVIDEKLEKAGLKWFIISTSSPRQIYTTAKTGKVMKPDDCKGLKWRTSRSPLEVDAVNAWGASAVSMGWAETLDALRTGMLQAHSVPTINAYANKLWDVTPYVGVLSWQVHGFVGVMNLKQWKKLPQEIRDMVEEAAEESSKWAVEREIPELNKGMKIAAEKGINWYTYTDEQREVFKRIALTIWDKHQDTCPPDYVDLIKKEAGPVGDTSWGLSWK